MTKPVIATVSLAGCFGCHMSLLDIDEKILDIIKLVEFNRSPIDDIKTITKKCDIGLIEGGCCNHENIETLKSFRKNCRILVAVGECAITGGLPSMRNQVPIEECLREAYLEGPSVVDGVLPNDDDLPMLLDRVYPIQEIVKVDYYLPGCPPGAGLIWQALIALVNSKPLELSYKDIKYD